VLATPLSTREILVGKWWGAYRIVPRLAVLPAAIALGTVWHRVGLVGAVFFAALLAALVLAYGAAVTSLGLAIATWQPRLGRAVALAVGCYLAILMVLPVPVMVLYRPSPHDFFFLLFSPFFGMFMPFLSVLYSPGPHGFGGICLALIVWTGFIGLTAYALFRAVLATFDGRIGRVPDATRDHPERLFPPFTARAGLASGRRPGLGGLLRPGLRRGPQA